MKNAFNAVVSNLDWFVTALLIGLLMITFVAIVDYLWASRVKKLYLIPLKIWSRHLRKKRRILIATIRRNMYVKIISQMGLFAAGIILCVGLALLPAILVTTWFAGTSMMFLGIPVFILLLGVNFVFIFKRRLGKLKLNHYAAPAFLGRLRFGNWVIGEGDYWTPPFIKLMEADMSEQVMELPPTKEDKGFTVTTLKDSGKEETGSKAEMLVRVVVRYKIGNLIQYLMFENTPLTKEENAVVQEGGPSSPTLGPEHRTKLFRVLRGKLIASLRRFAAGLTDEEFIRSKDTMAESILTGKKNAVVLLAAKGNPDDSITEDTIIGESLNSLALSAWGVEILEIIVDKAELKSESAKESRETQFKEKNQRAGERTELDHQREQISATAKMFREEGGMDTQAAMEEATRIVMATTHKVDSIDIKGGAGDVTNAAALFTRKQNQKKGS